jgi:Phage tail lysozyme/N-acetylmuramoyl-L-alanine amidase
MATGKHYGSFAKGFMDSLLAIYKLKMTKDLYDARATFYRQRGDAAETNANTKANKNAGLTGAMNDSGNAWGHGSGDGGAGNATLGANQAEAYNAARQDGLSDSASRALVANFTGEGLAVPGDKHLDQNGKQNAYGIAQWDDQRAAAIQKQFGSLPNQMSVADQTHAAIWEMKNDPRFADTWKAINSNASPQDMLKPLVTNYEQPKNPDVAINQRLQHLGSLPSDFGSPTQTASSSLGGASQTPMGAGGGPTPYGIVRTSPDDSTRVAAMNAPGGGAPSAFIMHHTAMTGSPQDIVDFWKKQGRGYGAQYIMDRDGVVHDTAKEFGYNGTNEIQNGTGLGKGLTNSNVVGMEIIAKNDKDVTPAQAKSAAAFVKANYPTTKVLGHGQVNPGHKEATEGASAVAAVNTDRGNAGNKPTRLATADEATTEGGGKFVLPGSGQRVEQNEREQQVPPDADQGPASSAAPAEDASLRAEAARRADPRDNPPVSDRQPPIVSAQDRTQGDPAAVREEADRAAAQAAAHPESVPNPLPISERPGTQFGRPETPAIPPRPVTPTQQGPEAADARTYRPEDSPTAPAPSPAPYRPEDDPTPPGPTQMGPEGPGRTTLPATINPNTDRSPINAPLPPPRPTDTANLPAKDAQPVSSPALPSNPAGNSGYTLVTPNSGPNERNRAQITAVDLSKMWGPNPPLSQQGSTPAPAPSPAPAASFTPPPTLKDSDFAGMTDDMVMGSAKGGAIPARPKLAFAAGGAAPVSSQYPSYTPAAPAPTKGLSGNVLAADQYMTGLPGMTPVDLTNTTPGYYTAYGAGSINEAGGQGLSTDFSKLTPAQAQQYNQMIAGTWTPPAATPAAAPAPTPAPPPTIAPTSQNIVAPAATATVTDPTTTTTTGTPGLPNNVTAKSYDPNVDQQTGAAFTDTNNAGGTNYDVGTDDTLQKNAAGNISGNTILSRKGGPIPRFAKGGGIPTRPTMKLATGGAASYAPGGLLSPSYSGPTAGGGWAGTPYASMAPNQQTWATNQQTLLGQEKANANNPSWSGWSQLSGTPDAVWPTAAPTAPAPLNEPAPAGTNTVSPAAASTITDPTTGTTTGAPGLPNSIQAKSYDPNVDAQTGAGFANTSNAGGTNYSVGTDDTLQQNASGQISGTDQNNTTILSRKGGSIPKVTRRVTGYDDGGGVGPSAAGMPPGLGGQQSIPPIYFNPATYAGAGAPVGKGISQNNASTIAAGAIPSLPMARGGVVGFDDGGMVGMGDPDLQQFAMEDAQLDREDAQNAQNATPAPTTTYNSAGEPTSDVDPNEFLQQPSAPAPTSGTPPTSGNAARANTPPPDPTTAEIHDGQGNPSKGLIAAIGDGLHWLGEHLGLTGGGPNPAIAANPQQQQQQQQFARNDPNGATYMSPANAAELDKINDPDGTLTNSYRAIARLEGGYKFAMANGDTQTAGRLAASILHYSVMASQQLSAQAQKALYDGDLKKTVRYLNEASDAVPDGRLMHATLSPDGKTVIFQNKDLDGRVLWQQSGAAHAVLERATSMGKDGTLQWNSLESQAAKYDSTFAGMQKARVANATGQAKADAADAESATETAAFSKLYPPSAAPTQTGIPSTPTPPTITAANAPPAPTAAAPTSAAQGAAASPDSAGAAHPNAEPPTSDRNQGQGPTIENAAKGAGLTNPANAPSPDAQNADLEHPEVEQQNRVAIRQNIVNQFRDPKTGAWTPDVAQNAPPIPVHPSQIPEYATANPAGKRAIETQYVDGRKQYDAWQKSVTDEMNRQATEADKNYTDDLVSRRQAATMAHSDTAADTRTKAQIDAAATLEGNRRTDAAAKQTYEEQKPLTHEDLQKTFAEHPPTSYLAASPATAVYKGDGTLDDNASAQALGKTFDLNDRGGLRRVDALSTALWNTQAYNTHLGPQQLGTTLTNMANGSYGYRSKPIDRNGIPMRQVEVFRGPKVGVGTPTQLLIPADDYDAVDGIKGEFLKAHTPPQGPGAPAAPTRGIPSVPHAPSTPLGPAVPRPMGATPPPASNPVGNWWHNMNNPPPMARGRGPIPPVQ